MLDPGAYLAPQWQRDLDDLSHALRLGQAEAALVGKQFAAPAGRL